MVYFFYLSKKNSKKRLEFYKKVSEILKIIKKILNNRERKCSFLYLKNKNKNSLDIYINITIIVNIKIVSYYQFIFKVNIYFKIIKNKYRRKHDEFSRYF